MSECQTVYVDPAKFMASFATETRNYWNTSPTVDFWEDPDDRFTGGRTYAQTYWFDFDSLVLNQPNLHPLPGEKGVCADKLIERIGQRLVDFRANFDNGNYAYTFPETQANHQAILPTVITEILELIPTAIANSLIESEATIPDQEVIETLVPQEDLIFTGLSDIPTLIEVFLLLSIVEQEAFINNYHEWGFSEEDFQNFKAAFANPQYYPRWAGMAEHIRIALGLPNNYQLAWMDSDGSLNFAGFTDYLFSLTNDVLRREAILGLNQRQRADLFNGLTAQGRFGEIDEHIRRELGLLDDYQLSWQNSNGSLNVAGFLEYVVSLSPYMQEVAINRLSDAQRAALFAYFEEDKAKLTELPNDADYTDSDGTLSIAGFINYLNSVDPSIYALAIGQLSPRHQADLMAYLQANPDALHGGSSLALDMLDDQTRKNLGLDTKGKVVGDIISTLPLFEQYLYAKGFLDQYDQFKLQEAADYQLLGDTIALLPGSILGQSVSSIGAVFQGIYQAATRRHQAFDALATSVNEYEAMLRQIIIEEIQQIFIPPKATCLSDQGMSNGEVPAKWLELSIQELLTIFNAISECALLSHPPEFVTDEAVQAGQETSLAELWRRIQLSSPDAIEPHDFNLAQEGGEIGILTIFAEFGMFMGSIVSEPIDWVTTGYDIGSDLFGGNVDTWTGINVAGMLLPGAFHKMDGLFDGAKVADDVVPHIEDIVDSYATSWLNTQRLRYNEGPLLGTSPWRSNSPFLPTRQTSNNMVIQETDVSCIPATCRQAFIDLAGINLPEADFRNEMGWNKFAGIRMGDQRLEDGLIQLIDQNNLDLKITIAPIRIPPGTAGENIERLAPAINDPSNVMIFPISDVGGHAIIVDRISDGKVYIRDPWGWNLSGGTHINPGKFPVEGYLTVEEFNELWHKAYSDKYNLLLMISK